MDRTLLVYFRLSIFSRRCLLDTTGAILQQLRFSRGVKIMTQYPKADGLPQKLLYDYNLADTEETRYERYEDEDMNDVIRFANKRIQMCIYVVYDP